MKAGELTLQGTLTAQQQYIIPIFQRYYTWDRKEWEQLWSDICELREKPGKRHFMGALVFVPNKTPVTYSYPTYQVIDGQQRIITLSLLLTALRNLCRDAGHADLAAEITNSVLVHQYKQGSERFRVYPRQRDREEFTGAVNGIGEPANRIGKALRFFTEEIKEAISPSGSDELGGFYNFLLNGLEFVHINLDGENPYKIFRSLNSTGVDLSPADLIRNFVFMGIPVEQQDAFDEGHWTPLESHFMGEKNEVNAKQVSSFFRDFLMMNGQLIAPADTFEAFEERYKQDLQPHQLVSELTIAAEFHDTIRGTRSHPNPNVERVLTKLRQLDSSTAYPLVLKLMGLMKAGQITEQQFAECVEAITGFIFRRYACGETSRTYAKWFVAACKDIAGDDVPGELLQFLVERGYPGDARFQKALCRFPLYEGKYAFAVLQQIEQSFGNKEPPNADDATIEHIMPQSLSKEWREDLGSEARSIHNEWLHTIGNLTFSGYNIGLSNKRFAIKLDGTPETLGYKKSNFESTKMLTHYAKWGADEIEQRGIVLAQRAVSIWVGPKAEPELGDGAGPQNPFSENGTRWRLFNILSDGAWHSVGVLQEQFKWNVPHRIERLRVIGDKKGKWKIEQENDKLRMIWLGNRTESQG